MRINKAAREKQARMEDDETFDELKKPTANASDSPPPHDT